MKRFFSVAVLSLVSILLIPQMLNAQTLFSGLDINPHNKLLFTVETQINPFQRHAFSYRTLFSVDIANKAIQQLSHFPEKIEILDAGRIIQIRNQFGAVRYSIPQATVSILADTVFFSKTVSPASLSLPPLSVSPDGNWLVFLRPTSATQADLVLHNVQTAQEKTVSSGVTLQYDEVPVRWAPTSKVFLYAHDNTVYFADPNNLYSSAPLSEQYRSIGAGSISNVEWYTKDKHIYCMYVYNTEVYSISTSELITRSLYAKLLGIGTLKGKLPFAFNSASDRFAAGANGTALMVMRNNRTVTYIQLNEDDFHAENAFNQLPYLALPASTISVSTVFGETMSPIVCVTGMQNNIPQFFMYQLNSKYTFIPLVIPADTIDVRFSPDQKSIAFRTPKGLFVYDRDSWKQLAVYSDEVIAEYAWISNNELCLGGNETIRIWNIKQKILSPIHVSSVSQYGWNEQSQNVIAQTKKAGCFTLSSFKSNKWAVTPGTIIRLPQTLNESWRVYTEGDNIFARSTASRGNTIPLLDSAFVERVKGLDGTYADKTLTIVFDALDTAEGLPRLLQILKKHSIITTFFINGEFIRRNPSAVQEILSAGHQAGSQFFSTYNLSHNDFTVDEEFILRGLARTEDDFYNASGQELSLVWHTPYYVTNKVIIDAGAKAGYTYVEPEIYSLDRITVEEAQYMPSLYKNASELIEDILLQTKDGSIIPITIGQANGTRSDFLYDKLDILIEALLARGYRIVPLSHTLSSH